MIKKKILTESGPIAFCHKNTELLLWILFKSIYSASVVTVSKSIENTSVDP